jgi:Methyltransferase domain
MARRAGEALMFVVRRYLYVFITFFGMLPSARAADAPYVSTPWNVVDALFKIGGVGAGDYVVDLGSGDGRIVISAAKKLGARGMGVELDANLVRNARRDAEQQGVSDRVTFVTEDLFFVDLGKATVVTMYMSEAVNLRLRPSLFKLKPGTRVLSHDFDMAQWQPDDKLTVPVPNKPYGAPKSDIFLWVVPANFSGTWTWRMPIEGINQDYQVVFEQKFQVAEGRGRVASQVAPLGDVKIRGDRISFIMGATIQGKTTWRDFRGRISDDTITGTVVTVVEGDTVHQSQEPAVWRATRAVRGKINIE